VGEPPCGGICRRVGRGEPAAAATSVVVEGVQLGAVEERGGWICTSFTSQRSRAVLTVRRRSAVVVVRAGHCVGTWIAAELVDPFAGESLPHTKFRDAVGHMHFMPSTNGIALGPLRSTGRIAGRREATLNRSYASTLHVVIQRPGVTQSTAKLSWESCARRRPLPPEATGAARVACPLA
jgi:hypothetical protein